MFYSKPDLAELHEENKVDFGYCIHSLLLFSSLSCQEPIWRSFLVCAILAINSRLGAPARIWRGQHSEEHLTWLQLVSWECVHGNWWESVKNTWPSLVLLGVGWFGI